MKKNLFLSFLFFCFSHSLFSQEKETKTVFGLSLGLNTSQIFNDDYFGFHQFGLFAGPSVNFIFADSSSVQVITAFSQKGARMANTDNGVTDFYILRTNYVDLPVIYMHRFKKKPVRNFYGEIGLMGSYLLNYSERNQTSAIIPARPFNKFEISGMIGAGYWIRNNWYVSLRGFNSLLPVRKHQSNTTWFLNRGQYNTVVQFSFNYFFRKPEPDNENHLN